MATWTLDKDHSEIRFKAKHLMITTVTGQFKEYEATVDAKEEDFDAAPIHFTAKTASVETGNNQRDEHLRSDDFFNVEQYPDLTFKANGMEKKGESEYVMTGEMTIRDVTKPITLNVEFAGLAKDPWGQTRAGFTFEGKLNRKDFGLKFHVVNEAGNLLVSDEIKLLGEIQLLKGE
ncbi:MAG: YceI family protein [Bacteroidetes bacterium]|nr:YceI family protein [Bacteroidota bacterium]MCH8525173.1 YceI family protein [Balneolales bacterium]